jgi:predicted O-methyltransferase YrrM
MLITRLLRELLFPGRNPVDKSQQPMDRDANAGSEGYSYTADWFSVCVPVWRELFSQLPEVGKILEIGSYEGRSAVWLIESAFKAGGKGEMYCIDTWKGGVEHDATRMSAVEERFRHNIALAGSRSRSDVDVHVLKGTSSARLASLVSEGHALSFDVIHVDGSHQCPDVLSDLVLSFPLCKIGGLMICDDYFWSMEEHGSEDLLNQPKLAVDSFVNCYRRKVSLVGINVRQLYLRKTSD